MQPEIRDVNNYITLSTLRLNWRLLIRGLTWVVIYGLLLDYLHPDLLWRDTVVTGGDMGSHYPTLVYLKEELLSRGRLVGWNPGNYAGFPQFQMYFPLPFLFMLVLDFVLPLATAFKLVSVAGVLALPLAVRHFLKNLGHTYPVTDIGAVFSLAFLFNEGNSAWGGNIASTLAGEFTYSIGLALSLVYLGRLYRLRDSGQGVVFSAVILAAVGLCHGYTLLFCVLGTSFFLITPDNWLNRLAYVLEINILAFCLMGFWIVPLLLFAPYSTPFNFVWMIKDWQDLFPPILLPFAVLGVIGLVVGLVYRGAENEHWHRTWFMGYLVLVAAIFYFIAFKIGVVDVRFIPFGQLFLILPGAVLVGRWLGRLKTDACHVVLALSLLIAVGAAHQERNIDNWAVWNYSGWESKELWPQFRQVTEYLKGDFNDPRVVYEHNRLTRAAGTIRAFESLPYFSGRATLEGVYIQASLTAPFVFYIQSQVSQDMSAPLTQYNYGRFDLESARNRLELFNVGHYVTVSEFARLAAEKAKGYELLKRVPPFTVFRVTGGRPGYAVEPRYRPVLALSDFPERDGYLWFRGADLDVPLVFGDEDSLTQRSRFAAVLDSEELPAGLYDLPQLPLPKSQHLRETIKPDEIEIHGASPGRPLWIRVSYHPNWKVEGADRVWRAGPGFMLVFPENDRVRLYFGRSWPDYLGLVLTILGIIYATAVVMRTVRDTAADRLLLKLIFSRIPFAATAWFHRQAYRLLAGALALTALAVLFLILAVHNQDPVVYYHRGLRYFNEGDYANARAVFMEALDRFPLSSVCDHTLNHLALTWFMEKNYDQARATWMRLEADYPESRLLPQVFYNMGLCLLNTGNPGAAREYWKELTVLFPEDKWAEQASKELAQIGLEDYEQMYSRAEKAFRNEQYREAADLYAEIRSNRSNTDLGKRAAYYYASSLFFSDQPREALDAFNYLITEYPRNPYEAESRYRLGKIRLRLGDPVAAAKEFKTVVEDYPKTRWGRAARAMLDSPYVEDGP